MSTHDPASESDTKREQREREHWRACIRPVPMAQLMAQPRKRVRYRVDSFARDGAITALCGAAGSGKSWLGMGMCAAVESGRDIGGMPVERGTAVYVDGEMGADQMVDRFRDAGFTHDAFGVLDVQGLDLGQEAGVLALTAALAEREAHFVVLDSMRRLSPGKRENESDDMAAFVSRLANMARDLKAAIVLLHHSGHNTQFARGSSAIADQVDAVFGYVVDGDARRLSCDPMRGGKFRFGRSPRDRLFLPVQCEHPGVVVVAQDKENTTTTTPRRESAEERYAALIPALVAEGHVTRRAIADELHVSEDNRSMRQALERLDADGAISWDRASGVLSKGGGGDSVPSVAATTTTPSNGVCLCPKPLPRPTAEGVRCAACEGAATFHVGGDS